MTALKKSSIDGTVVRDFAERTLYNLRFIEQQRQLYKEGKSKTEVFEVTQLINSMLGLIVFPKESFWGHLKPTKFEDIPTEVCPFHKHPNAPDLPTLIRLIRNSFSHFNLEIKEDANYITAVEMFNKKGNVDTWRDTVSVFELRKFVEWFITGIINSTLLDIEIDKIA